jgi:hypothetical protein
MADLDERFRSLKRTPAPDLWPDITHRLPTAVSATPRPRRLVAAVAAALVAFAGFAVAVVAFRSEEAVDSPSAPPVSALRGEIAATFSVGEDPRSVVYGAGSVWVAVSNNDGTFGGRILRIDPETNEIVTEIPVETIPTWEVGGGAMIVEGDSLWVTGGVEAPGSFGSPGGGSDAAVMRIDVTTNQVVDMFELGGTDGADLAFLDDELWVLLFGDESVDNSMELVRVEQTTGKVLTRIPLTSDWAHTLVAAHGRLVTYEGGDRAVNVGGRLTFIDAATDAVTWTDISPTGPVAWQDEVWVWADGRFARFDISTGKVIDRSSELDPKRLSPRGLGLETDDRAIWFLGYNGLEGGDRIRLAAFDPGADEVTELATLREGNPVAMAIAPDSVWILNYEGTVTKVGLFPTEMPVAGSEQRRAVDPQITATIPVGAFPRAVAVGEGAVWATVDNANGGLDDHLLVEIDPATNQTVRSIPLPQAGEISWGEGALWVTSWDGSESVLLRVDTSTTEIVASIPLGGNADDLAVGFGAIWVTVTTDESPPTGGVLRIDPASNEVVARIPVSTGWPRDVVIGEGSVWAYGHSKLEEHGWVASSLWRIDPTSNEIVATVLDQNGFLGDGGFLPDNVAVGEGWVWAADDRGNGVRIDPVAGENTTFRLVDDSGTPNGFAWPFLAYQGHVFFGLGTIKVLDTETFEVVESIPLKSQIADSALDPEMGTLWIANYEDTVTRIDL